jgi:hypothetical protein
MKILILGPLNYEDARRDLALLNYNNDIYSIYYTLEGLVMHEIRKGHNLNNKTEVAMYLASKFTEAEYMKFDSFYGLISKDFYFDKIIVYNKDILESQEAAVSSMYSSFDKEFYTTKDATHFYENIMEAIKGVEPEAESSNIQSV